MSLVCLLALVILLTLVVNGFAFQNPFWVVLPSGLTASLLLLFWNYRGIEIEVNSKSLLVSYGIFNRRSIPLEDIVSCEPTKASFGRYGGVGIRCGVDGSWAYTTSFGNAVKIIPRKGREFVFSSNDPAKICRIIKQLKENSP
ncbi:MAG: PH domain-containing protein [Candidatus Bathyarchaeota archaeon]|nr:PH domain-containing protein [Candidatus Bathyarchaeota archaeon]